MGEDGYIWSGELSETNIQSIYVACQSLRFSGKLTLSDGTNKAEVTFIAGEPAEIEGGDTRRIALFNTGTFKAEQSIPNFSGELTGQRKLEGSLAITKASQLWSWASEYRLTCEIDLERPGEKAVVAFVNGHADKASVNGAPELAALGRVSSWSDGTFRVRLRPLFQAEMAPSDSRPPPMAEGLPPPMGARQFDVSKSIPMDLKPKLERASFGPTQTGKPERDRTGQTRPLPKRNPFEPVELSREYPRYEEQPARERPLWPWLASLGALVVAGALGALYHLHLPPFSPAPRPLEPAPVEEKKSAPPATEKPLAAADKPADKTADEKAARAPAPIEKTGPPERPFGPVEKPKEASAVDKSAADKLILRARGLMVEGHSHSALDLIHRAEKLQPQNASYRLYEQQAAGKLGRATLYFEGKGTPTVDGKKLAAMKKLKLAAGPHTVDAGDGEIELTLKKNERRHIKVKK